jgi:hypothetical protein
MRERLRLGLAAASALCVLMVLGISTAPVDAAWTDRELTGAAFQAKTIPPVTLGGTAPYCSWTSALVTTGLKVQWVLPSGYPLSSVSFTAQQGTATQTITGQTSTLSGGVYTTTIPVNILNAVGSLLGGTVVIHVAVVDAATGWVSKTVDYSFAMSLLGIVTSCSAAPQ